MGSKDPNTRCVPLPEDDPFNEKQSAAWVKQAAQEPGDPLSYG